MLRVLGGAVYLIFRVASRLPRIAAEGLGTVELVQLFHFILPDWPRWDAFRLGA
jgi:hypothetical protein